MGRSALNRIAIVNRGESAMRAIIAIREYNRIHGLSLRSVALLTEPDMDGLVAHEADDVVALPVPEGRLAAAAYLDVERVMEALLAVEADAVWVGWGFVAENEAFARAVMDAGITFIGPSPESLALTSDKMVAKRCAESAGVPVVPWSGVPITSLDEAREHTERIGYPIVIKAAAGGGGRGIRKVGVASELEEAYRLASTEAERAFGDPRVFIEACVVRARHLEVQVAADHFGHTVALGVRDCTVQRRHQKVIEECPGPMTTDALRDSLERWAVAFARAAGYRNVGTVEFIYDLDRDQAFFMEMNPRLQVEHTVTEAVYGVDLVKLQLDIARGLPIPLPLPTPRGYAIEARLNAEDTEAEDAPAPGRILRFALPAGPGIRVDTGVTEGTVIPPDFDSMVAKVIAWGRDRAEAIARLRGALEDMVALVEDGATNKALLVGILGHDEFRAGNIYTTWLQTARDEGSLEHGEEPQRALVGAAILSTVEDEAKARDEFFLAVERGFPRKLPQARPREYKLAVRNERYEVLVWRLDDRRFRVSVEGREVEVGYEPVDPYACRLRFNGSRIRVLHHVGRRNIYIEIGGVGLRVGRDAGGVVGAPSPAMIISVDVAVGDIVEAGQRVATLESMKMEMPLRAPDAGRVVKVLGRANATVQKGDQILLLEPIEDDDTPIVRTPGRRLRLPDAHNPLDRLSAIADGTTDLVALMPRAQKAIQAAVADELTRIFLGYDVDAERAAAIERFLTKQALWDTSLGKGMAERLVDALTAAADVEWALTRRDLRGHQDLATISMETAFYQFARARRRGDDGARLDYRAHLLRGLSYYGIDDLAPSPSLDQALARMAISCDRASTNIALKFTLISAAVQLLVHVAEHGVDLSGNRRLETALMRLRDLDEDRWLSLSDRAAEAHYVIFQKPRFEHGASVVVQFIDDILRMSQTEDARGDAIAALVDATVAVESPLIRAVTERRGAARLAAAEALVRRLYNDRELDDVSVTEAPEWVRVSAGGAEPLEAIFAPTFFVDEAVEVGMAIAGRMAAPGAIDLVIWRDATGPTFDAVSDRLIERMASRPQHPNIERVTLVVASADLPMRCVTMVPGAAGWEVDPNVRDLHPVQARAVAVQRLAHFDLTRLPSREGVIVYRGVARDNPADERIFVLAEVRDVFRGRTLESAPAGLMTFEHALRESVRALRVVQARRDVRSRYHSNQLRFRVRPAVSITREEIVDLVVSMPVDFRQVGLDRLVITGRLADPDKPASGAKLSRVVAMNSTGHQLEVKVEVGVRDTVPVAAATAYDMSVWKTRRFNVTYPYEIVRMLTTGEDDPDDVRALPPGAFEEFDLRAEDSFEAVPVSRAPGQNTAGVVFGLITHRTVKHPKGMTRVLLMSDPLKSMGALAEPECRRIIAALDLATARGVPVEWVPVSAGAKIAMNTGTENLDWTAQVLRRIIRFTQGDSPGAGGAIHVIVDGVNVGAQSYFDAEATMLMHTRGALIMTPKGSMVLTGKKALDFSGGVSAADERGIGGYERIMGPNGQAQYYADNLQHAFRILLRLYEYTYIQPGEAHVRPRPTVDDAARDATQVAYPSDAEGGFATVGGVFSDENRERKRPFDMRTVMGAVVDTDDEPLERFAMTYNAETAIAWDCHIGGEAVHFLGFESRPLLRKGYVPGDGPELWTATTLFPRGSKKVARCINAASGNRPLVIFANLSGFDGSPESMRHLQLEYGAEIGRAVVNFKGPILFYVVGRYHGGAYVVFSKALNPALHAVALEGSYASVIGGAPAAAVVFPRDVKKRTLADARVVEARAALDVAKPAARRALRDRYDDVFATVHAEKLGEVATEFDRTHSVERACEVGSLDEVIAPTILRAHLVASLKARRVDPPKAKASGGGKRRRKKDGESAPPAG